MTVDVDSESQETTTVLTHTSSVSTRIHEKWLSGFIGFLGYSTRWATNVPPS